MHRFFIPSSCILPDKIILFNREQLHHLKNVLRLKVNDTLIVFDEKGAEYTCLLKDMLRDSAILEIKERRFASCKGKTKITVACALPKKSRMDGIIDQLTQVGVERIIPLVTARVIIRLDADKKAKKLIRWKKIALSAAQQSQRQTLPVVSPIKNLQELLSESADYDLKLIPTLKGERKPIREFIAQNKAKNILILIGPEGDFTPEEVNLAIKAGCIPVTLGDLVLRVDTACVAVASLFALGAK